MLKRTLHVISRAVALCEEYLVGVTLVLIAGLMCVQVVLRYVFAQRLLGYEEMARYTAMWLAFIGAGYATRTKTHVKADILSFLIKNEKTLKHIEIVQNFISFVFCTVFLYWLWILIQGSNYRSPALNIPAWIPALGIMVGFILMSCYFLAQWITGLRNLNNPETDRERE